MLQNGLVEGTPRFRVRRKAVPDHLVVQQIATLNIGIRTQNLIGDLLQLSVGPIAPCRILRPQLGAFPELLQLLYGVGKRLIRVADHHGPEISCQIYDQKRGDDDRKKAQSEAATSANDALPRTSEIPASRPQPSGKRLSSGE